MTDPLFDGVVKILSDTKAEKSVLGTMLSYKDAYYTFADKLFEDLFHSDTNRLIYQAIKVSAEDGKPVDSINILNKAKELGLLNMKGGTSFISEVSSCTNVAATMFTIDSHIEILTTIYKRRELHKMSSEIQKQCVDIASPKDIMAYMNTVIVGLTQLNDEEFDPESVVIETIKEMESNDGKGFIKSGIYPLDNFIFGFQFTDLVVIGGAPSMGKTAFALCLYRNFMEQNLFPVFFSLEMGKKQLITRIIASDSRVALSDIRKKNLSPNQWTGITSYGAELQKKKFIVDDKTGSLTQILNKIKKYYIKYDSKVFIIDYLQLIKVQLGKNSLREQEIATISRSLKEIARDLEIVIIALSQISRKVNSRDNKRPQLSDLRESGAIEQDADFVIFPYRPAYYRVTESLPFREDAKLIIAKGRGTGVKDIDVKFISIYTKYLNSNEQAQEDSELDF